MQGLSLRDCEFERRAFDLRLSIGAKYFEISFTTICPHSYDVIPLVCLVEKSSARYFQIPISQ